METIFLGTEKSDIEKAGTIIKSGGLVAIPTETVYGLAADALNEKAVKSIYEAKGRPSDNPLIVHISDFSQVSELVSEIPEKMQILADKFWPGPLTIIAKKSDIIPNATSGGLDTVAIRLPSSETARAVINASGCPIAAPSANLSGKPSPTKYIHVKEDLNGRVDAIINGGDCRVGLESTVITLAEDVPKVLRPGAVSMEELRAVLGEVKLDKAVFEHIKSEERASSPGMKYTHYAPRAEISVIDSSPEDFYQLVNGRKVTALCFDEDAEYISVPRVSYGKRYDSGIQANRLFSALHELDEIGAKHVFARIPKRTGIGCAVYNRLIRAAGFRKVVPNDCFVVGLTGTTGSGKTTVAEAARELSCGIVDADKVSKMSGVYGESCIKELEEVFGHEIINEDKTLNRKKLAEKAFSNETGKKRLEDIVFPRIRIKMLEEIKREYESGKRIIFVDAPTLFEAKFDRYCARIVVVTADEELRLDRIVKRDNISYELAKKRINAQHEECFYTDKADFVLDGGASVEALKAQTIKMISEIKKDIGRE